MKYCPLEPITYKDALLELETDDENILLLLPLRAGEYIPNWHEAQDVCVRLLSHPSDAVRANAILGLAYIARTKGKLDKRIVKPYILKELRSNEEYNWRIKDAVEEINSFLKWNIAERA